MVQNVNGFFHFPALFHPLPNQYHGLSILSGFFRLLFFFLKDYFPMVIMVVLAHMGHVVTPRLSKSVP